MRFIIRAFLLYFIFGIGVNVYAALSCPSGFGEELIPFSKPGHEDGLTCSTSSTGVHTAEGYGDFIMEDVALCPAGVGELKVLIVLIGQELDYSLGQSFDTNFIDVTGNISRYYESDVNGYSIYCNVPGPAFNSVINGDWAPWQNTRIVQACNASCTQQVEQTRSCSDPAPKNGGQDCSGSSKQVVSQSCNAGQGLCPINANTQGTLSDALGFDPTSPEYSLGQALENLCPQLNHQTGSLTKEQKDLQTRCANLIQESDRSLKKNAVKNLMADEQIGLRRGAERMQTFQLGNVSGRLLSLHQSEDEHSKDTALRTPRHPAPGLLAQSAMNQRGGSAGAEIDDGRWGVFFSGSQTRGEKDGTNETPGFEYDGNGLTLGADYLLDQKTIVGAAIGYGKTDSDIKQDGGSLKATSGTLALYGTRTFNQFYLDGVLAFGNGSFDTRRNLDYTASNVRVNQVLAGVTDGTMTSVSLGGGWNKEVQAVSIDLTARLNYLKADIDGYTETVASIDTNGIGLPLELDEQTISTTTADLGVRVSKAISIKTGVLIPSFSLNVLQEFSQSDNSIQARFANDPFSEGFVQTGINANNADLPTIFNIPVDERDSSYYKAGLGLNMILPKGRTLYINMNTLLGHDTLSHARYSLGFRAEL